MKWNVVCHLEMEFVNLLKSPSRSHVSELVNPIFQSFICHLDLFCEVFDLSRCIRTSMEVRREFNGLFMVGGVHFHLNVED